MRKPGLPAMQGEGDSAVSLMPWVAPSTPHRTPTHSSPFPAQPALSPLPTHWLSGSRAWTWSMLSSARARYSARSKVTITTAAKAPMRGGPEPTQAPSSCPGGKTVVEVASGRVHLRRAASWAWRRRRAPAATSAGGGGSCLLAHRGFGPWRAAVPSSLVTSCTRRPWVPAPTCAR